MSEAGLSEPLELLRIEDAFGSSIHLTVFGMEKIDQCDL